MNAASRPGVGEGIVESLSNEGRGVLHIEGKTVFIEGALTGERVRFRYLRRRGRHDEAVVTEVLEPSSQRVEPRCQHYGICGGCSFQHLSPEFQIEHKQQMLMEQLTHVAKVPIPELQTPVKGPYWGYRSKARLSVRFVEKKGRIVLGFMEKRGRLVADLDRCEVLHPSVGYRLPEIRALIESLSVARQIPQIEVALGDCETALILRHLAPLTEVDLERCLAFAESQSFGLFLQPGGPDSIARVWPLNAADLTYQLSAEHLEFSFAPADFTQVNRGVNESLVAKALHLLDPQKDDRVLDLFCGLGNFTLPLARRAAEVTGVEGDARLVQRAVANAKRNGIENASFYAADLTKPHPALDQPYAKVLLDPPRTGAAEVLAHLNCTAIRRLLYVSCNPSTLARDTQMLTQTFGFRLVTAGVLDMFPQTAHVESMALFERS